MTPDEFRKEYVEPAVEVWRESQTVTHLAASAIEHLDALADVVWVARGKPLARAALFREELGQREPAIAVIRDACDSHKHGELTRKSAKHISGERPSVTTRAGFFYDVSFWDGPPTIYEVLVIRKRDGSELNVSTILFEAMEAWRREFGRLGYGTDWLILGYQY